MAASTSSSNFEVYGGSWQPTLDVLWLQPSLRLGLTIVTLFYTAYQQKSNQCTLTCSWCLTPPPVWLVPASLTMSLRSLRDVLHWMPVSQRIQFNVALGLTAFDCVRGSGPAYFKDVCILLADICSRSNLRSAQRGDMVVPWTRFQLGRRSFHVAAPVVWNAPFNIHQSRNNQRWVENENLSL